MSNHQFNQHAGNDEHSRVPNQVSIHIKNMLRGVPLTSPKHTIFKVHCQLREVNEKAYDPRILAIGPYHYGNNKFKFMELQKRRYLKQLLKRKGQSVSRYTRTLIEEEQRARDHYAETIDLSQKDFLAMMIIDGCFIIELFRKYSAKGIEDYDYDSAEGREDHDSAEVDSAEGRGREVLDYESAENESAENDSAENGSAKGRDENDPVMHDLGIQTSIRRDLLLLENQLPFFVLSKLYDLIKGPDEPVELIDVAAKYLFLKRPSRSRVIGETEHLLHLYYTWKTSGLPKMQQVQCVSVMSSAAKLTELGVRFRAVVGEREPGDIKFKNETLEIPVLYVHDDTESKFRNLIAYEQHFQGRYISDMDYFTDYVKFMDCLINSSKDVAVLRHAGIIRNELGNDEVVVQMFNKMLVHVLLHDSYYSKIYRNVNMHCGKRRKVWMAKLRKDWMVKLRREYCHSPWAFLSVVAAIVLLLLTVVQTVFAVLSYTNKS